MIIRRIFISYDEADKKYANKIRLWAKRGLCCPNNQRVLTSVERERVQLPNTERPNQPPPPSVGMKILMSDLVIILIGNNTDKHPWLQREAIAAQKGVTRYFVRIPYTTGELPETLADLKQIAYNPNALELIFRSLPEKPPIVFKKQPLKKTYRDSTPRDREQQGDKREYKRSEQGSGNSRKEYTRPQYQQEKGYKPYHDRSKPRTDYVRRDSEPPPPPPPPAEPPLFKDNDIGLEW
jgi:hypothetical protein